MKTSRSNNTAAYIVLGLIILTNLFPVYNLAVNSFRLHRSIIANPVGIDGFTLENYSTAEQYAGLIRGVFNSAIICFGTILLLLTVAVPQAYAHVFIAPRIRKVIGTLVTTGYFVPPTAIVLNAYLIMRRLHLIGSRFGLILIFVALFTPISFIMLTGYMRSIPGEIFESARIDGASHIQICWKIAIPMVTNILVTLTILLFLWTYRDYLWPIIFLSKPAQRPLAVALSTFVSDRQFDFGALSAAVIVSLIPIVSLFIFLKDRIMSGMAAGAVKG